MKIPYRAIGTIHSPFASLEGMPIQPTGENSAEGTVEIYAEYAEGLQDLEGFSHIYLLYHFHRSGGTKLTVTPFMDTAQRGVFSTRAPSRPNPIGLSLVELVKVEGNRLHVRGLDVLDGTPLLDIKPYVAAFEPNQNNRVGWLESARDRVRITRADKRFTEDP